MTSGQRLLILSCSKSKRQDQEQLPAIERYNGPAFRVLRRFLSRQLDDGVKTYVLSAHYGLIPAEHKIPDYDHCMTQARAETLRLSLVAELKQIVDTVPYREMCLCVGRDYIQAMQGYESALPSKMTVTLASGGTGARLSQLYRWLYGDDYEAPLPIRQSEQNVIRFIGENYSFTPEQVYEIARSAILNSEKNATVYTTWYLEIDGHRVSPKWLVSKMTGVRVGDFHTDAARKFLHCCGVNVKNKC